MAVRNKVHRPHVRKYMPEQIAFAFAVDGQLSEGMHDRLVGSVSELETGVIPVKMVGTKPPLN